MTLRLISESRLDKMVQEVETLARQRMFLEVVESLERWEGDALVTVAHYNDLLDHVDREVNRG